MGVVFALIAIVFDGIWRVRWDISQGHGVEVGIRAMGLLSVQLATKM